jgi:hypothetical protein
MLAAAPAPTPGQGLTLAQVIAAAPHREPGLGPAPARAQDQVLAWAPARSPAVASLEAHRPAFDL